MIESVRTTGVKRIEAGHAATYPTPLGDIHVDQPLDEITLLRLVDGMRDAGLKPRQVTAVDIHGDHLITYEYWQLDADGNLDLDDDGGLIARTITAQR